MTGYRTLRRYSRDEDGATAIEYGLLASMILVVLISIFGTGGSVVGLYADNTDRIVNATSRSN